MKGWRSEWVDACQIFPTIYKDYAERYINYSSCYHDLTSLTHDLRVYSPNPPWQLPARGYHSCSDRLLAHISMNQDAEIQQEVGSGYKLQSLPSRDSLSCSKAPLPTFLQLPMSTQVGGQAVGLFYTQAFPGNLELRQNSKQSPSTESSGVTLADRRTPIDS